MSESSVRASSPQAFQQFKVFKNSANEEGAATKKLTRLTFHPLYQGFPTYGPWAKCGPPTIF